jgi:hypothetical protein
MMGLELFSYGACFLPFIERQIVHPPRRFSALFSGKQGDGPFKSLVHPSRHPRGHLIQFLCGSVFRKLDERSNSILGAAWARVGLERPHFFVACAPKRVFGVVPAHARGRKVSTMQMSAISIP